MSNSPLVKYTKLSPNCTKPRNHVIDTITIHCMAGNLTVETCGNIFAPASRQASSNYGVGSDGRVALYVDEANRSWCTSSGKNDHRAITIEVANDGGAPDWHVSDKAVASLIDLVTDICKRNKIKQLVWRADKNNPGNMTVHRWFANKACPGDYLYNLHPQIADEVNKRLNVPAASPETYYVRKTWADTKTQVGSYNLLQNAVNAADQNKTQGYRVFDSNGKPVYDPNTASKPVTPQDKPPVTQSSAPPSASPADTLSLAVKHAVSIIISNEGNYSTCVKNDNGALSIGLFGWHASRALSLMKSVIAANTEIAKKTLSEALYSEVMGATATAWNKRIPTDAEASEIIAMLKTPESKTVQDKLAVTDVTVYVQKGMSYGLTDCGALIYFADGVNQYGTASTLWKSIAEEALEGAGDVAAMFAATKAKTQNYLDRRERVYRKIIALNLNGEPAQAPVAPYTVRVLANALNIRKGPGTNFGTNGTITDKGVYTIVDEADGAGAGKWGKLKSGAGWISLDYTAKE